MVGKAAIDVCITVEHITITVTHASGDDEGYVVEVKGDVGVNYLSVPIPYEQACRNAFRRLEEVNAHIRQMGYSF